MGQRQSFYYSDGPYLQALQGLHSALSEPEAFIKLMGSPRTGKSALCDKLTQFLRRKGHRVIYFGSAIESPDMLRSMLGRELDLPDSANFARLLEDALADGGEKPLILIFDDAHLLTDITLIEIYRLAEIQLNQKRLLNIVLCGEPSLERRLLTNQEFKSLLLHVSHKFVLEPMDPETLSRFFYSYAEKAGLPGLQLEATAMNYFYKSSKGYPGPATTMSRLIVDARLGEAEMTPLSKTELVRLFKNAANNELLPVSGLRDANQWRGLMPIAAVIVVASVSFLYQQLQSIDSGAAGVEALATVLEPVESPFQTESEIAAVVGVEPEPAVAEVSQDAAQPMFSLSETNEEVATIPEPVSDSNLALVTAAEIGITDNDITQPQYLDLQAIATALESATADVSAITAEVDSVSTLSVSEGADDLVTEDNEDTALAMVPDARAATDQQVPSAPIGADEVGTTDSPADEEQLAAVAIATQETIPEPVTEIVRQQIESAPEPTVSESVIPSVALEEAVPAVEQAEVEQAVVGQTEVGQTTASVAQLQSAVQQWVDAWKGQSLDDYFSHYHSDFVPRYQDTVPAWRSNRQRVIGNADWIRLAMSDFQLIADEAGVIEVHFWLAYESPNYSDNTQKKLLLANEDGQWRILEEINLQVRS